MKRRVFSNTTNIIICLLIGLCFLWTGSGYLSWLYHLLDYYDATSVDIMTEIAGYCFQIAGLLLYAWMNRNNLAAKHLFVLVSVCDYILMCLAVLIPAGLPCLICGLAMNLLHGVIAGIYLGYLARYIRPMYYGTVFGIAYGLGSICSYLISLPAKYSFLKHPAVLICYVVIIGMTIFLNRRIQNLAVTSSASDTLTASEASKASKAFKDINILEAANTANTSNESESLAKQDTYTRPFLLISGVTIALLSLTKSAGFYFPSADLTSGNINLELSRAFYAVGLILAGYINDRKRSLGAILCIAALICPFVMIPLRTNLGASYVFWILGYVLFGFFVVYRVILFADLSRANASLSYLSCLGLMWGRIGDVAGCVCGLLFRDNTMALTILAAALFVVTIFLFFHVYSTLYMRTISVQNALPENSLHTFTANYKLSQRESEVCRLIIAGNSNTAIAEQLFISENTVKFHVKNLLKKTGCSNRSELINLYNS